MACPVDVGTVESATSEVVTNALVYGASDVAVTVHLDDDTVRVEAADDSPRLPVARHVAPDTTSGRGLEIVEAVTERWGVDEIPDDGRVVWFTVGVEHGHRVG